MRTCLVYNFDRICYEFYANSVDPDQMLYSVLSDF